VTLPTVPTIQETEETGESVYPDGRRRLFDKMWIARGKQEIADAPSPNPHPTTPPNPFGLGEGGWLDEKRRCGKTTTPTYGVPGSDRPSGFTLD
jgi:hypothetical protein